MNRLPAPSSFCTSFTEAIPLINQDSSFPIKEESKANEIELVQPATQSVGPSFFSYIQTFNTNGWMENERVTTENSIQPGIKGETGNSIISPSFSISIPNENSIMKTSFLPASPSVTPPTPKEKQASNIDTNSKLSNLFNRMIVPNSNSNFFSTNSRSMNIEGFQKDNSLCFPYSFDQPV